MNDKERIRKLEERIAQLEARVAVLEANRYMPIREEPKPYNPLDDPLRPIMLLHKR